MTDTAAHIDLVHLDRYVEGDSFLRDEVLAIFEAQAQSLIDRLSPLLEDDIWYEIAHTLTGSARGVGAWSLGEMSARAQLLTGDLDDKTGARAYVIAQMRAHIQEAVAEIRQLRMGARGRHTPPRPSDPDHRFRDRIA